MRAAAIALVAAVLLTIVLTQAVPGAAATIEARWSLHERASASSFAAGAASITPGSGQEGYEIVSLAAAGPSENLAAFHYAGADLPPSAGGPMPPLVTCDATFTPTAMALFVTGAYPYAGCVFFLGVANTGDTNITVDLGGLDARAQVTCDTAGCLRSDLDILAGGTGAGALSLCLTGGTITTVSADGETLLLAPGATLTCPFFVTVLQPAQENATYVVIITPPEPRDEPLEEETPTPAPTGTPFDPRTPQTTVPTQTATLPPTATPTPPPPISTVQGARTPGPTAIETPLAPSTGTGAAELVQRRGAGALPPVATAFGLVLCAAALVVLCSPRRA